MCWPSAVIFYGSAKARDAAFYPLAVLPSALTKICALQLEGLGLSHATAFGCASQFLFELLPRIRHHIAAELKDLDRQDMLTIGIQIRTGDHALYGNDQDGQILRPEIAKFFSCAEQIESSLPHQLRKERILWLLASDSAKLRAESVQMYGDKLTRLNSRLGHSFGKSTLSRHFVDADIAAFQEAVAEHYLLSAADIHIISVGSSYGRTAAFQALNLDGFLFTLALDDNSSKCKFGFDHTTLAVAGYHFAGI